MISLKKIRMILVYLIFLTISWGTFQIKGLYFFVIFQVLYSGLSLIEYKSVIVSRKYIPINIIFCVLLLTLVSGILADIPISFKKYSVTMTIVLIPAYTTFMYLFEDIKQGIIEKSSVIKYLKLGLLIQVCYMLIQFICSRLFYLDLNTLIFRDLLHFMENPSFYRGDIVNGHLVPLPSGFTWHSAYLAPALVLAFLLFDSIPVRALILIAAFICGNTTALVGTVAAMALTFIHALMTTDFQYRRKVIILCIAVLFLGGILGYKLGIFGKVFEKVQYVIGRFASMENDPSSNAHKSYYILFPVIFRKLPVIQKLFGTGYASSGNAIDMINEQYAGLQHWVTETDIIDILVSRGIVGFITYYLFLISVAISGSKVNYKYAVSILIIIIQGITYNVQFEYLFFIEIVMFVFAVNHWDLFGKDNRLIQIGSFRI